MITFILLFILGLMIGLVDPFLYFPILLFSMRNGFGSYDLPFSIGYWVGSILFIKMLDSTESSIKDRLKAIEDSLKSIEDKL